MIIDCSGEKINSSCYTVKEHQKYFWVERSMELAEWLKVQDKCQHCIYYEVGLDISSE